MVPAGYFLLVIFSNYFTVKRGNLAYFSSFLSLLKSNLKKSLIGSTQLGPFWIAIMNLYIKSFQKIYIFWECLIFCLNQTLAGCAMPWYCNIYYLNWYIILRKIVMKYVIAIIFRIRHNYTVCRYGSMFKAM